MWEKPNYAPRTEQKRIDLNSLWTKSIEPSRSLSAKPTNPNSEAGRDGQDDASQIMPNVISFASR